MAYTDEDRLLALGGIYQSALGVRRIATQGQVETALMEPCIFSLFQTEVSSVPDVFGEAGALLLGIRQFHDQLSGRSRDPELLGYVISLLRLERQLAKRPERVEQIARGIQEGRAKLAYFSLLHPNLLAHLADLYRRTISPLQPRIRVHGDPRILQDPDHQNRIRALLLAGIRSAWLLRQVGGSRWMLLFRGKRLLECAQGYLRPR